jgi:hypothetical protein
MTSPTTRRRAATLTGLIALAALPILAGSPALAVPITYSFSTGVLNENATIPFLRSALSGLSVTGTFTYDSDMTTPGSLPNIYPGALTNLSGTIGGFSFADPNGVAHVSNDTFVPFRPAPLLPPAPGDLLQLASSEFADGSDFTGFVLPVDGGYELPLLHARMFWIETLALPEGGSYMPSAQPIGDFLTTATPPAALPTFAGRLALDFGAPPGMGIFWSAFFDDLLVTPVPVPEPSTLALLAAGALALVPLRRRRTGSPARV